MKTKFQGKVPRTSGWKSDVEFDNVLGQLDISSLCFLKDKYINDIKDYPNQYDLSIPKYEDEYKELFKHKHMISEELFNRIMDMNASPSYNKKGEYFDSQTGCVLDKYGNVGYSIAYNEDETAIVYTHNMNGSSTVFEFDDETDYEYYRYHDRNEMYKLWNYTEHLNDPEIRQD